MKLKRYSSDGIGGQHFYVGRRFTRGLVWFFWSWSILNPFIPVAGAVPASISPAWVQRYHNVGSNSTDLPVKVVTDTAGDVVVTGFTDNNSTGHDIITIKYSGANGALLWRKRFDGRASGNDEPRSLAIDGSGDVIVVGYSNNGTNNDYYTAKYSGSSGTIIWERVYDGPGQSDDEANAVAVDAAGNVIVTGFSVGDGGTNDYYTVKYRGTDGGLVWEKRYNGPAGADVGSIFGAMPGDIAYAVAVDGDGNAVVTGSSCSSRFNTDYYTARYAAADGALLWEKRYDGPWGNHAPDVAIAVLVDRKGDVLVTGYSFIDPLNQDFYTAKYSGANGAPLWEKRFDGSTHNYDGPLAMAIDNGGNAIVTGFSLTSGSSSYDYYTAKYAASNGALLWEKRYNASNQVDVATSIATDTNDNVIVTGYSYGGSQPFPHSDSYTVKYAGADGLELWGRRYGGSSESALAVDKSGNVITTGPVPGNQFYSLPDFQTVKLGSADGALLWEKRFDDKSNFGGPATAVVIDSFGNVAVTGWSRNDFPNNDSDIYTAKYRRDGTILWENRYDGFANNWDDGRAMAVDGSGNVIVVVAMSL